MSIRLFITRLRLRLSRMLVGQPEPPSYERKREIILSYVKDNNLNALVETGTFLGDTTAYFADYCETVYSIELSEDLADKARRRFAKTANVTILQGDSGKLMPSVLKQVGERALFWLDGHFSGTCGSGDDPIVTARGNSDTPVVAELQAILQDKVPRHIFIDDARLFSGLSDYPSVGDLRRLAKSSPHSYRVSVSDDIIQILPNGTSS